MKVLAEETTSRFAKCIETSKRIRWEVGDVIQNRKLDFEHKFLPDGLTKIDSLTFLKPQEKVFLSQIQGRTYSYMFGLVERFINAKVIEATHDYWFGDQIALEALIRFADEELKHQALFKQLEVLTAERMPSGYAFLYNPDEFGPVVLSKSSWSVMALILHIELFTQLHYKESIATDDQLSPLFRDVFLYHWKEESQHAIMDELEWRRLDVDLNEREKSHGVEHFIDLMNALCEVTTTQADSDSNYFLSNLDRRLSPIEKESVYTKVREAYHWQYVSSGLQHKQFRNVLFELTPDAEQAQLKSFLGELCAT